ncbi:MAG: succinate dehydrogenase, cytochrome b556 subunit [Bacteroidetes bacterium SW_11_64_17]|jgi:succinate dehydrogenase / fumarate reductase cytochrome b subunit|nr:MAG: succinate dehydrogenase, cytochrome b556 subunit [Bacteroidetes bacterium SW_11_64_17]
MAVDTKDHPSASASQTDASTEQESRFQRYRIRTGMFAWMMHRLTGVGLVVYLIIHIWGLTALTDPETFNALIAKYHSPIFKVGEFALLVAVAYHAMNGLRLVLIDFLGWSPKQKKLFWTLGAVTAVIILVGGWPSLYALGEWLFGPGSMPTFFL